MAHENESRLLNRRLFLSASAATLGPLTSMGVLGIAAAQQAPDVAKPAAAKAKALTQVIADYVTSFDLKSVPAEVLKQSRIGFIDTVGVMLAGSREEVAHI